MPWAIVISCLLLEAEPAPNIVLLTVDTLRADYVGFYGCEFDTSPNLDAWAEDALVFDHAVCEVPLTGPSFISMMTSRYPRMTGTTRNGLRLSEDVPVVAEQFRAAGYETLCVQSNWTLKDDLAGIARGFDVYDDDFRKRRWGFIKSERDGDEVARIALKLLRNRDETKPLFAWFHWSDPHAPYAFHRKYDVATTLGENSRRKKDIRVRYASEVAFTDAQMARVMEALPRENTFIVFLADHGESLGEHDYVGHGRRLYENGAHIPLAVSGPGIEAGRTAVPVRGIDVGPTLLRLAGLGVPQGMLGSDLLNGKVPPDRPRVVETYGGAVPQVPGIYELMAEAGPIRQTAYQGGWKLIVGGDEPELFYLPEDDGETSNLAPRDPDRVAALRTLIEEWESATTIGSGDEAELTEDDIEALRSLGYIE